MKRGILDWLFFQAPNKKNTPRPRKKLPRAPKYLETGAIEGDAITIENRPEPVIVYPVPCDEGVLEAKIIDFVENDYGGEFAEADADTTPVAEAEPEEVRPDSVMSAVMMLLDESDLSPVSNAPEATGVTLPDEVSQEDEVPQPDEISQVYEAPQLDEVQQEDEAPQLDDVPQVEDAPQSNEMPHVDVAPQEDEVSELHYHPTHELPVPPSETIDEPPHDQPSDDTVQDWMTGYVTWADDAGIKMTAPVQADEDATHTPADDDTPPSLALDAYDYAQAPPEYTGDIATQTPPEYAGDANTQTPPEYTPKYNKDALPDYIREANDELPLDMAMANATPAPEQQVYETEANINNIPKADTSEPEAYEYESPQTHPTNINTNTCNQCGTISGEDDNFCGRCGTRLTKPLDVSAYCGYCGVKNEHMLKFCGDCGHKLVAY
ncbi:MAG: zinc ribbon domain-containing protein [Defluviitaleaceae bacterium]|nr:zinc ribbon domain-containing protein [Defluviitaleaceae bacterium]